MTKMGYMKQYTGSHNRGFGYQPNDNRAGLGIQGPPGVHGELVTQDSHTGQVYYNRLDQEYYYINDDGNPCIISDNFSNETPEKELLIFALYLNIGNRSMTKSRELIAEASKHYTMMFEKIAYNSNYEIQLIVMSVGDQDTKLECVFPSNKKIDIDILNKLSTNSKLSL